ncbi:MAG: NAD-dependent epimerase/dehydratase family protein, partial [Nevskiales bacterium]
MSKTHTRTALIAGATGVVGRELLALLLAEPRYSQVHVLSRRSMAHSEAKLKLHEVDFDALNKHSKLFYVDDVFCCLGTTMK